MAHHILFFNDLLRILICEYPDPGGMGEAFPLNNNTSFYIGDSPSGKAPDFDSVMHRFESCIPSHFLQIDAVYSVA